MGLCDVVDMLSLPDPIRQDLIRPVKGFSGQGKAFAGFYESFPVFLVCLPCAIEVFLQAAAPAFPASVADKGSLQEIRADRRF